MVPTVRPSLYTSIFAPTRCGVDPVVDTIVTSAAGSPFAIASDTAAKTSLFISRDYTGRVRARRITDVRQPPHEPRPVQQPHLPQQPHPPRQPRLPHPP